MRVVRVAILGSGFGAVHTALRLSKVRTQLPKHITLEIDLISRNDYFWLVTMAHEIATGNLMPHDVVQPIRSMPQSVYDNYIQAEITKVDTADNTVHFELLNTVDDTIKISQSRSYDYIVSSLGSQTFYFGVEGAEEYTLPVKTLEDVRAIKNRIMHSFEDAEMLDDILEIQKLLTFVIVGGGATGVEVAGELADMVNISLTKRFPKVAKYAQIIIVHGGNRIPVFIVSFPDGQNKVASVAVGKGERFPKITGKFSGFPGQHPGFVLVVDQFDDLVKGGIESVFPSNDGSFSFDKAFDGGNHVVIGDFFHRDRDKVEILVLGRVGQFVHESDRFHVDPHHVAAFRRPFLRPDQFQFFCFWVVESGNRFGKENDQGFVQVHVIRDEFEVGIGLFVPFRLFGGQFFFEFCRNEF